MDAFIHESIWHSCCNMDQANVYLDGERLGATQIAMDEIALPCRWFEQLRCIKFKRLSNLSLCRLVGKIGTIWNFNRHRRAIPFKNQFQLFFFPVEAFVYISMALFQSEIILIDIDASAQFEFSSQRKEIEHDELQPKPSIE